MPSDIHGDEVGAPELPRYSGSSKVEATFHPCHAPAVCTCVVQVRAHQAHVLVPDPHCPKHKETQ